MTTTTTTTLGRAQASAPVRATKDESVPKGLSLLLGLLVSLAAVIALTFWLASSIHDERLPTHPLPAAAAE